MTKFKLFLIFFALLGLQSTQAQEQYFVFDTVYSCKIPKMIKVYLKKEVADSLFINTFNVNGKSFNKTDTAKYKLACSNNYIIADFQIDWRSYRNSFEIDKPCESMPIGSINKGLIDSATQKAQVSIHCLDTSTKVKWTKLIIKKITSINGENLSEFIDSLFLTELDDVLNENMNLTLAPGKYEFTFEGEKTPNCRVDVSSDFWIGNLINARIDNQGFIFDSVYYWHASGNAFCNAVRWFQNNSCIDSNSFFSNPDSCFMRRVWYSQHKSYPGPPVKEAIFYDFNSDGIIDAQEKPHYWIRDYTRMLNDSLKSTYFNRIPEKYSESNLTIWSRDSLGQWISSKTHYINCAQYKRYDNIGLENDSLVFYHNRYPLSYANLTSVLFQTKINGIDTVLTAYDTLTYNWLEPYKVPAQFGYVIIKTWTDNNICDVPKFDTLFSCAGFQPSYSVKINNDSVIIDNQAITVYHNRVFCKLYDENNYAIDSSWVALGQKYIKTLSNGKYKVVVKSESICDSVQTRFFEVTTSGVYKSELNAFFEIYPNPATQNTIINSRQEGNYQIQDVAGRILQSGKLNFGSNHLNLEKLKNGSYLLTIQNVVGETYHEVLMKL